LKRNPYKVLGVNQKADPQKIKRAYRRAAKRYHPDVSPRDEEKFREVQEAYEILSDPERKALYDREISMKPAPRPKAYSYSYPLWTRASSLFNEIDRFFSTSEKFWMDSRPEFFGEWEEDSRDLSLEITLTPAEAKEGCEIPLKMPLWVDCRRCRGTGYVRGLICGRCRGRGKERIQKEIRITIQSGMKNGIRIRIPLRDPDLRSVSLIATLRVSQ
jgi:DnaJ-class molecular chaperone